MKVAPAVKAPVFIVGPPRSGTSLLFRSLQQHDDFRPRNAAWASDVSETKLFQCPRGSFDERAANYLPARHFLLEDESALAAFNRDTAVLQRWQRLLTALVAASPFWKSRLVGRLRWSGPGRRLAWAFNRSGPLLRTYFGYALQARGCRRSLEKTPGHGHMLPEIFATFGDAKVICILRHPVDVLASHRKRQQRERSAGRPQSELAWLHRPAPDFAKDYQMLLRAWRLARRRYPAQLLMLKYEDLVADPAAVLREVYAFLGMEPPAQLLPADQRDERGDAPYPELFAPIHATHLRATEYLAADEIRCLEETLAADIDALGYAPGAQDGAA